MPAYSTIGTSNQIDALTTGKPSLVWGSTTDGVTFAGEVVPAGTTAASFSVPVNLPNNEHTPKSYAVEIAFVDANGNPANPGAFEIDLLHATTQKLNNYVVAAQMTTGLNSSYVGRFEMIDAQTKFVALQMVTLTNAVRVIATIVK